MGWVLGGRRNGRSRAPNGGAPGRRPSWAPQRRQRDPEAARALGAVQPSSEGHQGGEALRAQKLPLSSLQPPSMAANPTRHLIFITDCSPWSDYSGLTLAQLVIYLAVSSWLSPHSIPFVFIEHLLPPWSRLQGLGLLSQGVEGSQSVELPRGLTSQQNKGGMFRGFPQGTGWFHIGLVSTPRLGYTCAYTSTLPLPPLF